MKIISRFSIALLASLTIVAPLSEAFAADAPPPPVVQLRPAQYDWSGIYAGGWVGLACLDGRGSLVDKTAGNTFNNGGCGFKGGALLGYNYQFDQFVVGAEADLGTSTDIVRNTEPTLTSALT